MAVSASLLALPAPALAQFSAAAPERLAGDFTQVTLGGLAVARDGSGGLVYTATSGGVSHVFLARLVNGSFQTPVQLDTGALSDAADPVITADNGGQLLVAFVSGGNLYAADTLSRSQGLSSPQLIATGASDPAISMNLYGVGYLAFTASDGGGDNVDVEYFNGSGWAPASPEVMNDSPGDVAGTGTNAPRVVAASDGVGIVAWGEAGHIYSRRVWGTATSTEIEQDDVPSYNGLTEVSATAPEVASGGDSSYPDIVFTESFKNGTSTQTRAMLTRLVAENTDPATVIDGISTADQDGLQPAVAMGELGRGLITAATGSATTSPTPPAPTAATGSTTGTGSSGPYGIEATVLANNGAAGQPRPVDADPDGSVPDAVPAVFGSTTSALAWDQDGGAGVSQVLLSYADDGVDLAAPVALSSGLDGAIQGQDGLLLAGDDRGDGLAAWVQGSASALSIYTAQLYTPPGTPRLAPAKVVANVSRPTLSWNPAAEDWGPLVYTVSLDNTPVAETTNTSLQLPSDVTDGTYSWQVSATNAVGESAGSSSGTLVVDTFAPRLRLRLSGAPRVASLQHLTLADTDPPNPSEPGATASGVKSVTISWGDGTASLRTAKLTQFTHAYAKAGVYRLTVTVSDEAANTTTLTRLVRVLP